MDRLVFEPIAGVDNRIDVRFTEAAGPERAGRSPGVIGREGSPWLFAPTGRHLFSDELELIAARLRALKAAEA